MTDYPTAIGHSDATSIYLLGQDLADDLMGQVGFGELSFWLVMQRRPTSGQLRVFEAVLVALADHGLTPSAIAARLTLTGAPESIQGALAAGLLGGGARRHANAARRRRVLGGLARRPQGVLPDLDPLRAPGEVHRAPGDLGRGTGGHGGGAAPAGDPTTAEA